MADAILQLSRWKRGKERMTSCSINFATKKNISGCSLLACSIVCRRQCLASQTCRWHLTQITVDSSPCFAQCFQGGSWDRACYHSLCVFLLSPSSLSLCGHRTKVWAFRHSVASRLCRSCSHRALAATPVPVLSLASSPAGPGSRPSSPRAQPSPILLGNGFSVALPGTRCNSGPSWWLSSAPSPTPPCLPPV